MVELVGATRCLDYLYAAHSQHLPPMEPASWFIGHKELPIKKLISQLNRRAPIEIAAFPFPLHMFWAPSDESQSRSTLTHGVSFILCISREAKTAQAICKSSHMLSTYSRAAENAPSWDLRSRKITLQ